MNFVLLVATAGIGLAAILVMVVCSLLFALILAFVPSNDRPPGAP